MPLHLPMKHRLTTLREHTNISNQVIDYIVQGRDDEVYYLELWFINRTLMYFDTCPLCYEIIGNGKKSHGSWCK